MSHRLFSSVLEGSSCFGSQDILNQPILFLKAHLGLFLGSVQCVFNKTHLCWDERTCQLSL